MSNLNPNQITIQVLAVDGDSESRLALEKFLARMPGMLLAAEADCASAALKKLAENKIDVALVDLRLPDTAGGIDLTKQIRKSHPEVRVVIFTASHTPEDIFSAMDAGADGYVLQGNLSKALEMAIRSVRLGAVWLDPGIAKQVLEAMQTATITKSTRVLPTGMFALPLLPNEKALLNEVATSNCVDGVCMVDPAFIKKLRRFAPSSE